MKIYLLIKNDEKTPEMLGVACRISGIEDLAFNIETTPTIKSLNGTKYFAVEKFILERVIKAYDSTPNNSILNH